MPKINVYLSEELAAAVKQAGVPVSPVCQQALTQAVAQITTARRAVDAIRDPALSQDAANQLGGGIAGQLTARLGTAFDLARERAGVEAGGHLVGTGQLLLGLLDEGGNLALGIMASLEADIDELRSAAERQLAEPEAASGPRPAPDGATSGAPGSVSLRLSELTMPSRNAIASAVEASIEFGHNYVGCEHLLLGLLTDSASQAGRALAESGVTESEVRRAMSSALAGFAHGRRWSGAASASQLAELTGRLESLERQFADLSGHRERFARHGG